MIIQLKTASASATYSYRPYGFPDYSTATIADWDAGRLISSGQAIGVGPCKASAWSQGITYLANNTGVAGNSITLVYNGTTDTVTSVTTAWNGANAGNQVGFSGDGATIPEASTVKLAGGLT